MGKPVRGAFTDQEAIEGLRDAAAATRTLYHACECGKRTPFRVPDAQKILKALRTAFEHGYGKPAPKKLEDTEADELAREWEELTNSTPRAEADNPKRRARDKSASTPPRRHERHRMRRMTTWTWTWT